MFLPWCWVGLHALVSAVATQWVYKYAVRHMRMDQPGERHNHQDVTPRGGGMSIVVALLVGSSIAWFYWPHLALYLAGGVAGLVMVAWIGWLDDHRSAPILLRLLIHGVASALIAGMVYRADGNGILAGAIFVLTVALINVWNFMDGINGLATSQAALVSMVYAYCLPFPACVFALALSFSCLGFLPFNFPRARIFLGDSGSGALGYLMAVCLALWLINTKDDLSISWIPLSIFAVDAGLTLLRRVLAQERWWEPHSQHAYQRAVRSGLSHTQVTLYYLCLSGVAALLFIYTQHLQIGKAKICALIWGCALCLSWWIVYSKLNKSKRLKDSVS